MQNKGASDRPTQRRYTEAEKQGAVRLVRALRKELGGTQGAISRVSAQLGYGSESVRKWVHQADIDEGLEPGVTSADAQRIKELEQENRELRRANELLKRASAFFAAELCATRRCVIREVVKDHFRWAVAAA